MKAVREITFIKIILCYWQYLCTLAENTLLLDVTHPLEPFQRCNVEIVYQRLHRSIYNGSSYEVKPLTFPHSVSIAEYTLRRGGPMVCNGHRGLQLVRCTSEMYAPDQFSLSCQLRVLINPMPCIRWQLQRNAVLFEYEDADSYKILPSHLLYGYESLKRQQFEYFLHVQVVDSEETTDSLSTRDLLVFKKFVSKDHTPGTLPVFSSMDLVLRFPYHRDGLDVHNIETTSFAHQEMFVVSYGQLFSIMSNHLERFSWFKNLTRTRRLFMESLTSTADIPLQPCSSSDIIGHPNMHKLLSKLDKSPVWIWELRLGVAADLIQQTQLRGDRKDPFVYNLAKVLFPNSSILIADRMQYPVIEGVIPMFQLINATFPEDIYFELPIRQYFVSCSSILDVPSITLAGYVSSFDFSTWIGIGVSVAVSCWLLFISQGVLIFQQVIFAYMLLVGQGVPKIPLSRLFFTSWLFAWVFITEHYRGSNIDKFVLPLNPSPLDSFEELIPHNFTYYAPSFDPLRRYFAFGMSVSGANETQPYYEYMVKHKKTNLFDIGIDMFSRIIREKNYRRHDTSFLVLEDVLSRMYVPSTVQEFLGYPGFDVYKRYKTCSREAYVSDYKNAAMFFHARANDGQTPNEKLHFNKKPLQNAYSSINANSLMPYSLGFTKRVYILLQSGLDKIWAEWSRDNMLDVPVKKTLQQFKLNQTGISMVKAVSLADNILTVFIAWGFGILLAILSIVIENTPSMATLKFMYARLKEIISWFRPTACLKYVRKHMKKSRNTPVEQFIT